MNIPATGDLAFARTFLDGLAEEVALREGTLAGGGAKLREGGKAIKALQNTKVTLGNPRDLLGRLTPALFDELGITLKPMQRHQLQSGWAFYHMTMPVTVHPGEGAQFSRLCCHLDFGPKGTDEVIIQAMFPEPAWKPILQAGASITLGATADLDLGVALDVDPAQIGLELPATLKAKLVSKNEVTTFLKLPDLSFVVGRTEISTEGKGQAVCLWEIHRPDLLRQRDAQFTLIFKVPDSVASVELTARAWVEPSMSWLATALARVSDTLSTPFRAWLSREDSGRNASEKIPLSDHGDGELHRLPLPD